MRRGGLHRSPREWPQLSPAPSWGHFCDLAWSYARCAKSAGTFCAVTDIPNDTSGYSADELMRLQLGAISNRTILQSALDHQIALQERQHQEHLKQQETADFQKIVGLANDHLEGLPIPEDFANRYLAAEYQFNPGLKEAWDHRRDSPGHDDYATRVIKRVFKQMRKSASRIPDLQATEDRAAVTAAVRGSSNQAPPSDTAADYRRRVNNMSDAEFRKHADEVMDR
jgi:hypothetical protein